MSGPLITLGDKTSQDGASLKTGGRRRRAPAWHSSHIVAL